MDVGMKDGKAPILHEIMEMQHKAKLRPKLAGKGLANIYRHNDGLQANKTTLEKTQKGEL